MVKNSFYVCCVVLSAESLNNCRQVALTKGLIKVWNYLLNVQTAEKQLKWAKRISVMK